MMQQAEPIVVDHPLIKTLVSRLRTKATQPPEFRALVDKITGLLLFRAMSELAIAPIEVESPLATTRGWRLTRPVAFAPVLRAGLGMVAPAQRLVPDAAVWHLGLYRDEQTLDPVAYYSRVEPGTLDEHEVFVLDPMLATAGTAVAVLDVLKAAGVRRLHLVAIIAAPEGVKRLSQLHPDVPVFLAAIDERLSGAGDPWPTGYVLPGLGDAGDRQFGT